MADGLRNSRQRPRPFARLGRKLRRYNVPYQLVVESFGTITGALFLFSALLSAITMKVTLGLDYFSIATPSDVLMNGVKALGLATLMYSISFSTAYSRAWLGRRKELRRILSVRRLKGSPARHYLTKLKAERDHAYRHNFMLAKAIIPAIIIMAVVLNAEGSGMVYVSGADLPTTCSYREAKWVGSQSAVIKCSDRTRVIRDGEGIVYLRPKKDCGIRIPICRFVDLEEMRQGDVKAAG